MPLLLPVVITVAIGVQMNSLWTASAWTLLPVVLLSSRLTLISGIAVRAILGLAVVLPPLMIAAAPAVAFFVHRSGMDHTSAHGWLLAERIAHEWRETTQAPLLLIAGDPEIVAVTAFYLPTHPTTLRIWDQWLPPRIDTDLIAREGIALVCDAHDVRGRPICQRRPVRDQIDKIITDSPASRRVEIEITRQFAGIPGQSMRYVLFVVPPRP